VATAPIPIQQQSQQPQPSRLSDLLTHAHQSLSQVRDHYADLVNRVGDTLANVTSVGMIPALKKTQVGKGIESEIEQTIHDPQKRLNFATGLVQPGGEAGEEALAGLKGVKVPKGQMKPEKIMGTIEDAAMKNNSLHMTYQNPEWDEPKQYHVEPYSYRGEGNQTLMAYDKLGKGIRAFKLDNIINVAPSGQEFKPRWEVEIAPKLAKSEQKALPKK